MSLVELLIISIGLSMDAFAVAICKGLAMEKINIKKAGTVGLYFGIFQAGMPLIGYFLGIQFQNKITSIDHWIAFILLGIIGINMIRESIKSKSEVVVGSTTDGNTDVDQSLDFRNMSILAIATSIDALAVGVTFAFLKVNIMSAVIFIGIITFLLSMLGVKIGNVFGMIYKAKAEFTGGFILILMGTKTLLAHIGII